VPLQAAQLDQADPDTVVQAVEETRRVIPFEEKLNKIPEEGPSIEDDAQSLQQDSTTAEIAEEAQTVDIRDLVGPAAQVVDDFRVSSLQRSDSQFRGDNYVPPANSQMQLGPDDYWYVVSGGAKLMEVVSLQAQTGGPSEFGPVGHSSTDAHRQYSLESAARFEEIGALV
jgi:hypothetical protein